MFATFAIYSYQASRLAIPILFILFTVNPINLGLNLSFKKFLPLFFVFILCVPTFISDNRNTILVRLKETNIFSHWEEYSINQPYHFIGLTVGHILSYFSPANYSISSYSWITGSPQGISGTGAIGWVGGFLLLVGLWYWFKDIPSNKGYVFYSIG